MNNPTSPTKVPLLQAEITRNKMLISELEILLEENIGIISSISSDISKPKKELSNAEKSRQLDYIESIQDSNLKLDILSTRLSKLNELLKTII